MKPDTPNAATLKNLLVDYGHIENLILCSSDAEGLKVLHTPELHSNERSITIWCNSNDSRTGPINLDRKNDTEGYWNWRKALPQALLSQVRTCFGTVRHMLCH